MNEIFTSDKVIGFTSECTGTGDQLKYTHLPENFFKNTGKRLVSIGTNIAFTHNPYIEKERKADIVYPLAELCEGIIFPHEEVVSETVKSAAELHCKMLGLKCFLRHPRVYFGEHIKAVPNRIVVHTTGKTMAQLNPAFAGHIPEYVIEQIRKIYGEHWEIIQIGGRFDCPTTFQDKRGAGFWETAELIASAAIFIGVNSGMLHLARCYPRISRKVVLVEFQSEEYIFKKGDGKTQPERTYNLKTFQPNLINPTYEDWYPNWFGKPFMFDDYLWLDYNCQYYNCTEEDVGITNTYKKI